MTATPEELAAFDALLEQSPLAACVYQRDSLALLATNAAFGRIYGYSRAEARELSLGALFLEEDRARLLDTVAALPEGPHLSGPWVLICKGGAAFEVELASQPVGPPGSGRRLVQAFDVSAREKARRECEQAKKQLVRSQRMETVALLTSGLAHDFNNLLTGILGYVALVEDALPPGLDEVRQDLDTATDAARRATVVTRRLLTYARRLPGEPALVDLSATVLEMDKVVRRLLGADIEFVTLPGEGIPPVRIDPGGIEQVLMNLVLNAREAMPQGGRLEVSLCEREVGGARFVELAVTDTGVGMDDAVKARVFEPRFTTKEGSQGSGLLLCTALSIVRAGGGQIEVQSAPGQGSRFTVRLPRAAGKQTAPPKAAVRAPPPRGHETVLLVEDEAILRDLGRRTLEGLGYRVLAAATGGEALEVEERHAGQIQVVLTDVVMPGMNGRTLAEELRRRRPGIRTLFVSGYADRVDPVYPGGPEEALLQKPFTPPALAKRLREVLDSGRR
jgi:PAS domain S-box-containing protein